MYRHLLRSSSGLRLAARSSITRQSFSKFASRTYSSGGGNNKSSSQYFNIFAVAAPTVAAVATYWTYFQQPVRLDTAPTTNNTAETELDTHASDKTSNDSFLTADIEAVVDELSADLAETIEKENAQLTATDSDDGSTQTGAYNPETDEFNWDCSCLGGMANGPCGEEFKEAFACFMRSNTEPKGMECIEKFSAMQGCFRRYPEVYADEIKASEPSPEEVEAALASPESLEAEISTIDSNVIVESPSVPVNESVLDRSSITKVQE